jgi:hypothetical protein
LFYGNLPKCLDLEQKLLYICHLDKFYILEGVMKCHRCGGVMVFEKFYGSCEEFFGWRCVLCGEIVDQVILENRLGQSR